MSPRKSSETRTFVRFCTVGGFGFAVDAGVLAILTMVFGVGPIAARLVSGAVSMLSTWVIHRSYTFKSTDPGKLAEGSRFATVTIAGVVINFVVYWCVLTALPATPPLVALAGRLGGGHGSQLPGQQGLRLSHRRPSRRPQTIGRRDAPMQFLRTVSAGRRSCASACAE